MSPIFFLSDVWYREEGNTNRLMRLIRVVRSSDGYAEVWATGWRGFRKSDEGPTRNLRVSSGRDEVSASGLTGAKGEC